MNGSRIIVHDFYDGWTLSQIINEDFPILKENGYTYAIIFEDLYGSVFIYGYTQRWRAIRHAMQNKTYYSAYDLLSGVKIL